ncbi:MAG TPA: hypothetical protein VGO62_17905 [Myxococcota bacterium]|jgi:hypothetical protein
MWRALVPRFLVVIVGAPLAFVAAFFGAVHAGCDGQGPAAVASACTFAAVIMAPSAKNALVRAAALLAIIAIAAGGAALLH